MVESTIPHFLHRDLIVVSELKPGAQGRVFIVKGKDKPELFFLKMFFGHDIKAFYVECTVLKALQ